MTLVDVFNRALDIVGTQSIQGLADSSKESRLCNRNWDVTRRSVLRMHPWNWAIKRVNITARLDPTPPAFDFQYAYNLPTDYLRLTQTFQDIDDWRIENNQFITDNTTVQIGYVADVTNPDLWDPIAADAVSHYLAWGICFSLTQSNEQKAEIFKAFDLIMKRAKFTDSIEDPKKEIDIDVWMRSRVGPSQGFVRDPMT